MNKHVMFVEDDTVVRESYSELLRKEGFMVSGFADHGTALASASENIPDLALLDISLNKERDAGFHLCADLRRLSKKLPIIIFTSQDSESDKIAGIRLGADDYMSKDVSFDYLVIRMEALLRRCAELSLPDEVEQSRQDSGKRTAGPLMLDLDALCVYWHDRQVDLSLNQIRMIDAMVSRHGQVASFSGLMKAASICVEPNTVAAHIRSIRRAFRIIDPSFNKIRSVRGMGYRWLAD